ncbi:MAG: SpoIIE family protein phosphatase [Chitinivibrionales bacterium]|nr:SpoIIE family protein phosphatase [Chitinivibrionales bacterium]MBD3394782.1 SpoIIE family protein phosphatase [Chitinivibrionales bacterium]
MAPKPAAANGAFVTEDSIDYRVLYEEERARCQEATRSRAGLETANARLEAALAASQKELRQAQTRLDKARAEIDEEMEIAKSVQAGLLPGELPEFVNLKTADTYIPTGKVGGDLYDITITPTQKVAILIFDVSGHGIPAALIAAMAKMLFAHYIEKLESPSVVFSEVNKRLCSFINTDHYLTAFLGILDPIRNRMVYARAGHVRPLVYRAATGEVDTLGAKGFFIGHSALIDIAEYTEESVTLSPGDKVLFYTDGLTEGSNASHDFYGVDRLRGAVERNGALEPQDFLDAVLEDQTKFRNGHPLRDDFSMLCIETSSAEWVLRESGFTADDQPRMLMASTYVDIDHVCSVVLRGLDDNGYSDADIKRAKICVFEMLMNAIEHGNRNDPAKRAVVLYTISPDELKVSVVDEGEGFDYEHLPNPLAPENLLKDHGRGVFIIREYMDEVQFNSKGNRMLVVKRHHGGADHGI